MYNFIDCNSSFRKYDSAASGYISEEVFLRQLQDSVESGLIPDREKGIFIREGFGALVGWCPENCKTIEDAINYSTADFNRKTVGKPTVKEKISEFIHNDITDNFYFNYNKMLQDGYDLVIGPGCSVYGEKWGKAIYCRNYEEILNRPESNQKSR